MFIENQDNKVDSKA